MTEAVLGVVDDTLRQEGENARSEFAQLMVHKRAGPDANTVRKIYWFWTTLADIDMRGKDSYKVVAAARRLAELSGGRCACRRWRGQLSEPIRKQTVGLWRVRAGMLMVEQSA